MGLCLNQAEIVELTHKERSSAQVRALNRMGIDNSQRPDGSVLVYIRPSPQH